MRYVNKLTDILILDLISAQTKNYIFNLKDKFLIHTKLKKRAKSKVGFISLLSCRPLSLNETLSHQNPSMHYTTLQSFRRAATP